MAIADVFKGLKGTAPFQVVATPITAIHPGGATLPAGGLTRAEIETKSSERGGVRQHPDPDKRASNEALELLEKRIKNHRLSWIAAGQALAEVRDSRLYRLRAIDTFEEYCQRRWELSKRHAYDLIAGFEVASNVRNVTHLLSLRAAVQLAKLKDPLDQARCLSECIARSGSRSPTADYLRDAVAARLGKGVRRRAPANKRLRRVLLSAGAATIREDSIVIKAKKQANVIALLRELLAQLEAEGSDKQGAPPATASRDASAPNAQRPTSNA